MADELHYASAGAELNKRKYENSPPPRRASGFSSTPEAGGPTPSYNNVPPPMNEIELAKQKAQEIAARLLSSSDPLKRARVENGAGGGGFDFSDAGIGQRPLGLSMSGPPQSASYGYGAGPTKKIEIPNGRVGVIIGKGGETIKYLQLQSGAKIQVTRDMDADPNSTTRGVELTGTPDQIAKAEQLITDVLSEAESGGSSAGSRRMTGQPSGTEQFVMMIPNNKVGLVIGKGGETIKNMQAKTGARIQVIPLHLPPGDMSKERTLQIDGTSEQIEAAKVLVNEVTSENRRNPSMSGGYPQQGYQSRPSTNWAQPSPPMQQSGYGYVQPGAYPGPAQYNMNQPPYSGYPPQPASGGYTTGWDQSTAPQNPQAAQGYDYYNQQPSQQQPPQVGTGAPPDAPGYNYTQQAAYNQGYGQDSYGGYQAGYGEPQQNPSAGYDQQQYNSTYGSAPNPTPDSYGTQTESNQAPAPGQAYNASADPSSNPNYPPQASTQPSYGVPPSSQGGYGTQPTGYSSYGPPQAQKPQQSPSAQGGGYTQPGYPQTDPGAQKPPSLGYPPQPGYGAPPPYGVPPAIQQPSYSQQAGGAYNSLYGSGYSVPPPAGAYSSDGSNGGGNVYGYDVTPPGPALGYDVTPPQSGKPTGPADVAKASPPS